MVIELTVNHRAAGDSEARILARHAKASRSAIAKSRKNLRRRTKKIELPRPPPAWPPPQKLKKGAKWLGREPSTIFRYDVLAKHLATVPVEKLLGDDVYRVPFLSFCDELVRWTKDRLNPPAEDEFEDRADHEGVRFRRRRADRSELYEWRMSLGNLLARVGLSLSSEEVQSRFLRYFTEMEDDDEALSFLSPFVRTTIATGLLDAPVVSPSAVESLNFCLERVLAADAWASARYREGTVYGHDLPSIIRELMLVPYSDCPGSARFANGDWSQLHIYYPLVARFVAAVGDVPLVADAFMTLCEHAAAFVPARSFSELALSMLTAHGRPVGWDGTRLPARLAANIQAIAEHSHPLPLDIAQTMLRVLDVLVDMGDRRSAALEVSETFKDVRVARKATNAPDQN